MRSNYQFGFCPELQAMVHGRVAVGRRKKFDSLAALSSENNLIVLRNLCLRLQPSRTLEIGLSLGGSCLVFVASHRDLGREPCGQHVAIDPYQSTVWDDCGLIATERACLSGYLDFRAFASCLELPKLINEGRRIDCAYIDGLIFIS